jgi:hypothetical protein
MIPQPPRRCSRRSADGKRFILGVCLLRMVHRAPATALLIRTVVAAD